MKKNMIIPMVWVLTLIIMMIGATISYFTSITKSEKGINVSAASVGFDLLVEPLYTENALLPIKDEDILNAYKSECMDINNNGACQAYNISINNTGETQDLVGIINFKLDNMENLKYLVLDDKGEAYTDKIKVISDSSQSLGDNFTLNASTSKKFVLLIWLPDTGKDQPEDMNGSFLASVTYTSASGSHLTGSIAGVE